MNTMSNYEYNEGIEFIGLIPKVMEADGIKTIGASDFNAKLFENGHLGSGSLEMVDFFETAFGGNGGSGGEDDKPKYVDLGLPSGTLWANYNIGAKTQYESGLYFAWGEISGYTKDDVLNNVRSFDENSYKYQSQNEYTKYNGYDGYFKLDKLDDASTYFLGACYRIPTSDEIKELIENTNQSYDLEHNGVIFTRNSGEKSGTTLFLPCGGVAQGNDFTYDKMASYINSSLCIEGMCNELNVYNLHIGDNTFPYNASIMHNLRFHGFNIRPVFIGTDNCITDEDTDVDYIDFDLPSGTLWASSPLKSNGKILYFAWAGTNGKTTDEISDETFTWENCPYYDGDNITKYTEDLNNKFNSQFFLEEIDDAASQILNQKWQIPTTEQWEELIENTTQVSEDNAIIFIKGEKELSLPKLDGYDYDELIGNGCYWTNKLEDKSSNYSSVAFDINSLETTEQSRYIGLPIIPTAFKCKC